MSVDRKTNQSHVNRQAPWSCYTDLVRDEPPVDYFDAPRPANDNKRVYRSVRSAAPYHCYNSTSFKYVDVPLPRVSILDGAAA